MNAIDLISRRPVAWAACVCVLGLAAGVAHADDEDTPLYLSLSHRITRDSNFSRDANKQGETINATALEVGIDKAYGRQRYRGGARLTHNDYAHYGDQLNNDGKNLSGTVSSGIARNWLVSLDGSYDENLNAIQNNLAGNARVVRNIRKYSDGNVTVQYGNGGRWALVGSLDANKLRYSDETYAYQNADQHSGGLKLVYYSSDLLNFGLGGRRVWTSYNNYQNSNESETISDNAIDLSSNWKVTGLSQLSAFYSRRRSTYATDTSRHSRGWTANVNWDYTPRGLLSYRAGYTRASGNDRLDQNNPVQYLLWTIDSITDINYNTLTTTYNLGADYQATGKVRVSLDYRLTQYEIDNVYTSVLNGIDGAASSNSINHNVSLGVHYAYSRSLNMGCSATKYSQTKDFSRVAYEGRSATCFASLTID